MKDERMPLTKLTGSISRSTQAYANGVFSKYELGSGTYPYLLSLYHNEGISQNQISKELDVDKAVSARAIKKLIQIGYIRKESNHEDSRAFRLYLTEKAKKIIPDIKRELQIWNDLITQNLNDHDKKTLIDLLSIVLTDTKNYRKVEG